MQPQARKLRRTASAKFSSQNDGIWTDIVGDGLGADSGPLTESGTLVASFGREGMSTRPEHMIETKPQSAQDESSIIELDTPHHDIPRVRPISNKQDLFYGRRFCLHGFDTREVCTSSDLLWQLNTNALILDSHSG